MEPENLCPLLSPGKGVSSMKVTDGFCRGNSIWPADPAGMVMNKENKAPKACPVNGRTVLFVEERDGVLSAVKRD